MKDEWGRTNSDGDAGSAGDALECRDGQGNAWRIELRPGTVRLVGEDETIEVPASRWAEDVYAAAHGSGCIVRFETFERSVGFILSQDQARALVSHLRREYPAEGGRKEARRAARPEAEERGPLLWPKVSPLAVWALITASLSYVPGPGWVMGGVAVALLMLHGRSVREARAYAHSRVMCGVAWVFLGVGLGVSLLCVRSLAANLGDGPGLRMDEPSLPSAGLDGGAGGPSTSDSDRHAGDVGEMRGAGFFDQQHNWGLIAAGLLVILFSLTIHEAAHAVSAWWLGDDLARRLGRVTLKPTAHIDPIGTVLLPLILFLAGATVFGWARPVPVRVENLERPRRAHILISLAGPGSNLLLASASMMLLLGIVNLADVVAPGARFQNVTELDLTAAVTASGFAGAGLVGALCTVLKLSFFLNVLLAFLNLIPIPPLDGSWVLEHMFPRTLGPLYEKIRPFSLLIFIGLVYTKVLYYLLFPALVALLSGVVLLELCTPG